MLTFKIPTFTEVKNRDTRSTGTHIDTLGDNTPKARRRLTRRGSPSITDARIAAARLERRDSLKKANLW